MLIVVVGIIVIEKLMLGPGHVNPLNCKVGFMVTNEVATEVVLELKVLNTGIFPVPLADNPMDVFAFDQAKLVPGTLLVIGICVELILLQKT